MFKRKSLFFLVTAIHRFLSHFPTEIFWGFAGGYRKGRGDATAQFPPNLCACHGHGPPWKKNMENSNKCRNSSASRKDATRPRKKRRNIKKEKIVNTYLLSISAGFWCAAEESQGKCIRRRESKGAPRRRSISICITICICICTCTCISSRASQSAECRMPVPSAYLFSLSFVSCLFTCIPLGCPALPSTWPNQFRYSTHVPPRYPYIKKGISLWRWQSTLRKGAPKMIWCRRESIRKRGLFLENGIE